MKGQAYLGWPKKYLSSFLKGVNTIAFIPFAGVTFSYDEYTNSVQNALNEFDVEVIGIHTAIDKEALIKESDCVMVGGGNTFSLLSQLQNKNLVKPIQDAISGGKKYVGWSAGSNMACPTIKTTNDMPIEEPQSFDALNLVGFQINPHFTNETIPNHGGESRELRIKEFLVRNPEYVVVGLPEGMLIEVNNEETTLAGKGEAVLFKADQQPIYMKPGKVVLD